MSEFIEIHWVSGTLEEARKVSRYLVQERYVASANILPWVESIYMLNNQLETTQESMIIFKSTLENYEKIKEIIKQNSKYEVPEISYVKVEGANNEYLEWLQESVIIKS